MNCLHKVGTGLQANSKSETQDGSDAMVIDHTKKPPSLN
jgi:hypothetical protein